jgi:hypothetical protein
MNTQAAHSTVLAYGSYANTEGGIETLLPMLDRDLDALATEYGTETRAQRLEQALRRLLDAPDLHIDSIEEHTRRAVLNAEYVLESD